ncbi:hypothetical protein TSUD_50000 [Trifolium subterraneum]|uniref:Protein kinase domain-containing protein n=1 Tax=Trifolium subterraneum TaxID=3900 RepID=A0A2Z6LLV0_TRISU|nr:hypothetical protein TSUD_50000 [Trifolium subterraneum]
MSARVAHAPVLAEWQRAACPPCCRFNILKTFIFSLQLMPFNRIGNGHSVDCPNSFDCGNLGLIKYPFTTVGFPNCGVLAIQGCDDINNTASKTIQLTNGGRHFQFQLMKLPFSSNLQINVNSVTVIEKVIVVLTAANEFIALQGQGGFGSVYKGKLHDERVVAVKVLSESKGDGEDFINEVASISRTSHVNVVRLLGFCLDGSKKALLYEFMPNGSLEKFIYEEKNPLKDDRQLDGKTLYDIAVGVARGLEYLHRGCNTRILHFDIKPHNILLDEDFCPKISDFGLAKICLRKDSIVSIVGARGTPGYIAPELFSRSFGGVSHKSDVYSYGMMVLEMVGRRNNIKVEVDCSSDLYFPHWIYKRLELNQDMGLKCIKNEIDEEMVRKMTVVSLWCIQTDPKNRPAMRKVVEMLEGSLQMLEIPLKPYLYSPSASSIHLSSGIL